MDSREYRNLIARIIRVTMKKYFVQLGKNGSKQFLISASKEAAINIHARMYGANVDGVASPIWRGDGDQYPRVDASEMLKDVENASGT